MFKKKFKVTVDHFSSGNYAIYYCHYRFIPNWRSLKFWFDQGHPGGTEFWATNFWPHEEAEKLAKTLNSIEDIREYYKPYEEEEARWREKETQWRKDNVPYQSKAIK